MKLSIIVPLYNCEKYISNCLDSLLNQNLSQDEYEIVIVNDGSTDNSEKIVKQYLEKNKNIKLINTKNGGVSRARNIGIENSKGVYLFFVDADDYIAKDCISSNILKKLVKNEIDVLFFDIQRVENYKNIYTRYKSEEISSIIDGKSYFINNNVNNGPWHYFINREFLNEKKIAFKVDKYCEDGMFLIDIMLNSTKVSYTKTDIYRYVNREGSTTTNKDIKHNQKIVDDFYFAINYINNYYKKAIEQKDYALAEKLKQRRDSYTFFMQLRMIKNRIGRKKANNVINDLKNINCYKYKRLSTTDYQGIKYTILAFILNNEILFKALCG